MSLYLHPNDEQEIGLKFRKPLRKEVSEIADMLGEASTYLGATPPDIHPPEKGFLVTPLYGEQRWKINHILGKTYALQNSKHREELRKVPIHECMDRMVSVRQALKDAGIESHFSDTCFHPACGEYAGVERLWYARQGVVDKLIPALRTFKHLGIEAHLEDCYRPPVVQRGLLLRRIAELAQQYRDWGSKTVRVVSMSLTASVPGLAGHQAGAAIDMRLVDSEKREFLDLGNSYSEANVLSCINCPYVTYPQFRTRMLFANVLRMANFKLLPTENWHVSHGDRGMGIDGPVPLQAAIYGPLKDFDRTTGDVDPYDEAEVNTPYLSGAETRSLVSLARKMDSRRDFTMTPLEAVEAFSRLGVSADDFQPEQDDEGEEDKRDE